MDPIQSREAGFPTVLGLRGAALSAGAIVIGVFVALIVQILLALLGAGIGFSVFRVPASGSEAFAVSWGAFVWWALSGILAAFAGGLAAFVWAPSADVRSAWVHGFLTWCVTTVIVMAFVALAAGSSATLMANLGGPAAAVAGQVEIAQRGFAGEAPQRMTPETRARVDSMRRALGHLSLASFFALLLGGAAGVLGGNAAYESFRPDRPEPRRIPIPPGWLPGRVTWSIPPGWLPRRPQSSTTPPQPPPSPPPEPPPGV
jgi:hypothetical protein